MRPADRQEYATRAEWQARVRRATRWGRRHWLLSTAAILLLLCLLLVDALLDEPVRRHSERGINARLKGYSAVIPAADFRPWLLATTYRDVIIRQDAHPDPPVVQVGSATVDLDWSALFRGRLVMDVDLNAPVLYIDTRQLREEWTDEVPIRERGWQHVFEFLPLEVNRFGIRDGVMDYVDTESGTRLRLSRVAASARNIRHVTDREARYPSPVRAEAVLFDGGRLVIDGHADLLNKPWPGIHVLLEMAGLPLAALGPVTDDLRLDLEGGVLSARGRLEVAPELYVAEFEELAISGVDAVYLAGVQLPAPVAEAGREVAEAAREANEARQLRVRADQVRVDGSFGYRSDTDPAYTLRLQDARLALDHWSNVPGEEASRLSLDGLFMGSGRTRVRGIFRPTEGTPDFALDARIVNTELPALNDLLRAHARADVSAGRLSVYAQVAVRDGRIDGYVKPLLRDVEVHEPEDDRGENVFRQLYEVIVEQVARVLENRPRDEIATVVDLSGTVEDPDTSVLSTILGLLRNAFVEAILPGFDPRRDPDAPDEDEEGRAGDNAANRDAAPSPAPAVRPERGSRHAGRMTQPDQRAAAVLPAEAPRP